MKNIADGIYSGKDLTKGNNSELEYISIDPIQNKTEKKKKS